jgi:hypothetical protein
MLAICKSVIKGVGDNVVNFILLGLWAMHSVGTLH